MPRRHGWGQRVRGRLKASSALENMVSISSARCKPRPSRLGIFLFCLVIMQPYASEISAGNKASPDSMLPEEQAEDWMENSMVDSMHLHMPLHHETTSNQLRCAVMPLQDTVYITGFTAQPTYPARIHHMTLFACENVDDSVKDGKIFNCLTSVRRAGCIPVAGYEHMGMPGMPGMNKETPKLPLTAFPPGVVFPVGPRAAHKYVLIEEHNNAPLEADTSGFRLRLHKPPIEALGKHLYFMIDWDVTTEPSPKRDSSGALERGIPPGHYQYTLTQEVAPKASRGFRVFQMHLHFHSIGKKLIVEKRSHDGTTTTLATRVGTAGQTPRFDPPLEIQEGDTIRASCIYDSSERSQPTPYGMDPVKNEMCNVFLMCSGNEEAPVQWLDRTFPQYESTL